MELKIGPGHCFGTFWGGGYLAQFSCEILRITARQVSAQILFLAKMVMHAGTLHPDLRRDLPEADGIVAGGANAPLRGRQNTFSHGYRGSRRITPRNSSYLWIYNLMAIRQSQVTRCGS